MHSDQTIKDIMSTPVICVTAFDSVRHVVRLLSSNRISATPIVNEAKKVIGIISSYDIIILEALDNLDKKLGELPLRFSLEKEVLAVSENQPIKAALLKITKNKIGRVLVLNELHQIKGVVTRGDLMRHYADINDDDSEGERYWQQP